MSRMRNVICDCPHLECATIFCCGSDGCVCSGYTSWIDVVSKKAMLATVAVFNELEFVQLFLFK